MLGPISRYCTNGLRCLRRILAASIHAIGFQPIVIDERVVSHPIQQVLTHVTDAFGELATLGTKLLHDGDEQIAKQ